MRQSYANLLLLLAAAVWGLAFVFQKTAMEHIGPYLFLAARSFIAALVLLPLALRENRVLGTQPLPHFWIISALGGISFFVGGILQQIGLVTATVTNTGFLTGLYVVVTPLLMWVLFQRMPQFYVWPAIILAFCGTWLLGGGTLSGFSYGDWLVAVSAIFWAAHILVTEQSGRHVRPIGFTATQFFIVALLSTIGAVAFETISFTALAGAVFEIAYVGILSSALTFTLLAIALKYTPPAEASILVSMETVFAALCAFVMLGERLSPLGWSGAAVMFSATLIVHIAPTVFIAKTKK